MRQRDGGVVPLGKAREDKTNAMRMCQAAGIEHRVLSFEADGSMTGVDIAHHQGLDPDLVFKTLVTEGKSGEHYVFMIPVAAELDLKKAATAVGEKAIHMIKSRELLPLTGYVHGGCSPLGMKKQFTTVIDETAELFDTIFFSGGRIGTQIEMAPSDLETLIPLIYADVTC